MATISNIIQTIFQSSGANGTNRDIENINRNMTRLGQTSAGAGRSFAAQSQGLGGLVAAYAGAAATTFALQQAFDKLAQSARQSQTLEGLNTLAARSGESSTILLNNVREITKNQLTLAEAASQINLSLSAGFDSSQIEGLSDVALKASRALGRDLNDAYTRVVRGSAKMETELLDELGIYTKIEPATRAYALAINKNVNALTEFERRQAFVNSVIEEGNRKYSSINTTIPTTAEKIEAFGTRILDIGGALGRFLADQVAPLAEFLTNNLTASFAAFGSIAALVAAKGVSVLRDGLDVLTQKIIASGAAAEQSFRKFLGVGKATATASAGVKNYARDLVGVTTKEKELFKALQETAKTRNLSNKELKQSSAILAKNRAEVDRLGRALVLERRALQADITTRNNAIQTAKAAQRQALDNVRALRQQGAATQEIITAMRAEQQARIDLANATRLNSRQLDEARNKYIANRDAINGNISALRALQKAEEGAAKATGLRGRAAGLLSRGYEGVATTLGSVGNAFTSVVGKALGIFSIISLFTLLGSSIADVLGKGEEFDALVRQWGGTIKSLFVDSDAKRISTTLQGISIGALEELEKTDEELRNIEEFTFTSKVMGIDIEVTKTKEDLVREVNSELTSVLNNTEAQAGLDSWGSKIGGVLGAGIFAALGSVVPGLGNILGLSIGAAAGSYIGRIIQDTFSDGELTIGDIEGGQTALTSLKQQYSETFEAVGKDLELNLAKGFQNIEERLGRQALFDPIARQALKFQKDLFAESGKYLKNIESISELMTATGQSANVIKEQFNFKQGELSAQQIASTIVSIGEKTYPIKFSFIDTLDEDLKNFLENTTYTINLDVKSLKYEVEESLSDLDIPSSFFSDILNSQTFEEANLLIPNSSIENILSTIGASEEQIKRFYTEVSNSNKTVGDAISELDRELLSNSVNLTAGYEKANASVNTFQASIARSVFNAQDLADQLALGNVDLETFDQRMKAVTNSTANANNEYVEAAEAIRILQANISKIPAEDKEGISRAKELLAERIAALEAAEASLNIAKEYTAELLLQREELERQKELSDFLGGLTKDTKSLNTMSTQLEQVSIGLPEEGKLIAKLVFLENLAAQGQDQLLEYRRLENQLVGLNIAEEDRIRILRTSSSSVAELVRELNKGGNTLAKYENGQLLVANAVRKTTDHHGNLIGKLEAVNGAFTAINLQDDGGKIAADTKAILDTIETLVENAAVELPKLIGSATSEFKTLIKNLRVETASIRDFEIPQLEIEARLDRSKFNLDMAKLQGEQFITQLELELDINALKRELGDITPEKAIEEEGRIQEEILNTRQQLIEDEMQADAIRFINELDLLNRENQQNISNIGAKGEQIKAESRVQMAIIDTYYRLYASVGELNEQNISNISSVYNDVNAATYKTIVEASKVMYNNIVSAMKEEPGGTSEGAGPTKINYIPKDTVDFTKDITDLNTLFDTLTSTVDANTKMLVEAENTRHANAVAKLQQEFTVKQEKDSAALANLETLKQKEDLLHRKRIKDLENENKKGGKSGDKEAERALKEAEKTLEKFYDDVEKGLKELQKLAVEFVSIIFDALVKSKQLEVEAAKVSESLTNSILSNTTARLNSVQSDLNEALSKETSLKEELVGLSERLNTSQLSYLRAVAEGDLATASEDYIDSILEQSRKTIELNRAMRDRAILEGAAQTLEQQQLTVQEQVKIATQERIEAERELAEMQATTSGILELLSTDIFNFNDKLKDLAPALAAVTGQVDDAFKNMGKPIEALATNIDGVVKSVKEAAKVVAGSTKTASKVTTAAANEASSAVTQGVEAAGDQVGSTFAATAVSALSSALQGAGIGQTIGQILGDETSASTIGGALGAAVGSIIPGIGTIIGGIAGSLIGSLFGGPVKPAAYIRGNVTSEGYETYDVDRKDGLSQAAANSVESLVSQVYDSIFTSLERVNVKFKDDVDVFVRVTEGEFGRIRTTFKSGAVLTAKDLGSDPETAAQELINEFLGGLTVERNEDGIITFRSLVVDALTPNASDVQQALDIFAELDDINKKTQEQFDKVVSFASGFKDSLAELNNAIPTLENSIALITSAAQAGAQNAIQANREYIRDAEEAFGLGDPRVEDARKAVVAYSLAQVGVMRTTGGSLMSLKEYESGITAAGLAVVKTIEDYKAFGQVLVDAGLSAKEAGEAISFAIGTALVESVESIADIVDERLALARDPSFGAVKDVLASYGSNKDLIKELEGQRDALLAASDPNSLLVPVEAFEENLNNVIEEAFSNPVIKDFIESLSEPIDPSNLSDTLGPVIEAEAKYLEDITEAAQKALRAQKYRDPDEGYNMGPQIRREAEEALTQAFSSQSTLQAARELAVSQQPELAKFFDSVLKPLESLSYYDDLTNKDITLDLDTLPEGFSELLDVSGVSELIDSYSAVTDAQKAYNDQLDFNAGIVKSAEDALKGSNTTQTTITKAEELARLEFQNDLKGLTATQIEALLATEDLTDATDRRIAQERLVVQQQIEAAATLKRLGEALSDFNSRIADLRGGTAVPVFTPSYTSIDAVMEALGQTEPTDFSNSLTTLINSMTMASDATSQFNGGVALLDSALASGEISTVQYIDSLYLLSEAALAVAEGQKELIDAYESAAQELKNVFSSTLDEVQSSISGLRDELIGLVDSIQESTSSIFNIYDDTLADLAGSGNELFSIRDSAREAFAASAEAVKQFEEANSLSGKSAEQLRTEISSIEQTIASLLSGGDVDLAAFRQLSELSARQNSLTRQLSVVSSTEAEYSDLIKTREQAANDLAFAEAAIIELGDSLIDTRRTESETIQQVQDATVSFVQAQKDLEDITQLLAESNFDLNQIRSDETSRVQEVSKALQNLESDLGSLEGILTDLLSNNSLQAQITESARDLGAIIANNLGLEPGSLEWEDVVNKQVKDATEAFEQGLVPLSSTLNTLFNFGIPNLTGINEEFEILTSTSTSLTKKFSEFNQDLVKYLDSEGLALFYGSGGVFSDFRDSLVSTLTTNGFDILTKRGGPLEGFELTVANIKGALNLLGSAGITSIENVTGVSDSLSSLVQVIGTDSNGLTTAVNSLVLVGDVTAESVRTLNGVVQDFYVELNDLNSLNITFDAKEQFDSIVNSVVAFDTQISEVNVDTSLNSLAQNLDTQISVFGRDISSLSLTVSNMSSGISTYANTISDSVDGLANSIVSDLTTYNTTIREIIIDDVADYASIIKTDIQAFNSELSNINFVDLSSISSELQLSFDRLLGAFTIESSANVDKLSKSLEDFSKITSALIETGLDPLTDTSDSIDALVSDFKQLQTAVDILTDGGGIDALKTSFLDLVDTIADALAGIDLTGPAPSIDYTGVITQLYREVLNRDPDPLGLSFYKNAMKTNPDFGVDALRQDLFTSPEKTIIDPTFQRLLGRRPSIDEIYKYKGEIEDNRNFDLDKAIKEDYNLNPATQPDITGTQSYIPPGDNYGDPVTTTGDRTKNPYDRTNIDFAPNIPPPAEDYTRVIENAYRTIFGREVDPAGLEFYKGIFEKYPSFNEDSLKSSLRSSPEYGLQQIYKEVLRRPAQLPAVEFYLDVMRNNPNFDLRAELMNSDEYKSMGFASGGYVSGLGTSISDSIYARLSNGEFVMQASAVKKLGIQALEALNATGDITSVSGEDSNFTLNRAPIAQVMNSGNTSVSRDSTDGDTSVEVNVINNGTAQQPSSEPVVRRENGKIIVDVILEDIRNNGPIKRTIRSIR